MRTKENRQLDKTQRIENSIKQTTKSVARMNLGCRFSFWLLVDSRCLNSILPKKNKNNPTEEMEALIPDDMHMPMQHV